MRLESIETARRGMVWLIGSGPGDPQLLTIEAVRALEGADVVFHDDLVHLACLRHAPSNAPIVAVGKRGGCRSTPQAFIERRMIAEAQAGNTVVRLKGDDPFVFGRGGYASGTGLAAHSDAPCARFVRRKLSCRWPSLVPLPLPVHRRRRVQSREVFPALFSFLEDGRYAESVALLREGLAIALSNSTRDRNRQAR